MYIITINIVNNYNNMIYNTTIVTKAKHWGKFVKLVMNQWKHGGAKYKGNSEKESTDMICEVFPGDSGVDWVLGTMMKYLVRYKNFGREKDLLKIACYSFILWIKGGFHLLDEHDQDTKK